MKNKFDHHIDEFIMGKRLSLYHWQQEQDRIRALKEETNKKQQNEKKIYNRRR